MVDKENLSGIAKQVVLIFILVHEIAWHAINNINQGLVGVTDNQDNFLATGCILVGRAILHIFANIRHILQKVFWIEGAFTMEDDQIGAGRQCILFDRSITCFICIDATEILRSECFDRFLIS